MAVYLLRQEAIITGKCTNIIFHRRVGDGNIFINRLLMEHFAAMYEEK